MARCPGSAESALSISSSRLRLVTFRFHSDSGLRSTKNSAMLTSFGSVPSSGRPAFDITRFTLGIPAIKARIFAVSACASVTDTLDGSGTLTQIEPSFSSGRNSVPRCGTSASAPARAATAVPITRFGRAIDQRSTGW